MVDINKIEEDPEVEVEVRPRINPNPRVFARPQTSDSFGSAGIDLLDYFAGQALVGIMSLPHLPRVERAYNIAEAMLAERLKRLTKEIEDQS